MTRGLIRYQQWKQHHFVTFSCFHRKPFLASGAARVRFERALEIARVRYDFVVMGYVVMPEHVHPLVTEPERGSLARARSRRSKFRFRAVLSSAILAGQVLRL